MCDVVHTLAATEASIIRAQRTGKNKKLFQRTDSTKSTPPSGRIIAAPVTRGINNIGQKMTDKRNLDLDDIDSFLVEDTMTSASGTHLPEAIHLQNLKKSTPRNNSLVDRLYNRITHATKSLKTALDCAQARKELLSAEQESCHQLSEDMRDWENVLTKLEAVIQDLPEIHAIDAADNDEDSLHEDITDAIASHLDAELQTASDKHNEDKGVAEEMILSKSKDIPATPPNDHVEIDVIDDSEIKDDEDTTNSNREKLLHALEQKESRIRELEAKLDAWQSTSDDVAESGKRSGLIQRDDGHPYVNRLIVNMNGGETLKYPLSKNIMTIGREPHNDIHIRSRYISRVHARIVSDQDGSIIEDLDSRNGIAVNAKKVRRQVLKSGDLIDLGRVQLKFIDLMEGSADEGRA